MGWSGGWGIKSRSLATLHNRFVKIFLSRLNFNERRAKQKMEWIERKREKKIQSEKSNK